MTQLGQVREQHLLLCAGDHIGNLWWRLLNGHLPVSHPPKVAVVLIGINEINNMDVCIGNPAALAAAVANMTARWESAMCTAHADPAMHRGA